MRIYRSRVSRIMVLLTLVTCPLVLLLYSSLFSSVGDNLSANLLSRKLRYQLDNRETVTYQDTRNVSSWSGHEQILSKYPKEIGREDEQRNRPTTDGTHHRERYGKHTEERGHYDRTVAGNERPPKRKVGADVRRVRYPFNCSNVEEIRIKHKIGHGVTKQVYLGMIHDGRVAVKMVTRNVLDVTSCVKAKLARYGHGKDKTRDVLPSLTDIRKTYNKDDCYTFPNMKLMKEILMMEQIEHPNLVRMLGYCVRSVQTESTSLQDHGVIAVYEYASRFYVNSLISWSLRDRLSAALEMADLLRYFQYSPLGSLRISDLKEDHFLLKDGHIKMTDLDDLTSLEPSCTTPVVISINKSYQTRNASTSKTSDRSGDFGTTVVPDSKRLCHYGLRCLGGICPGFNARYNLDNMNRLIFRNLLSVENSLDMDTGVVIELVSIQHDLDRLKINAGDLSFRLRKLLTASSLPL